MLLFSRKNLVFLAVPRAASTAVEAHLAPFADAGVSKTRFPKHVPARIFYARWASRDAAAPEAFAILRHPIDRLGSWYRYRQRGGLRDPAKSTADMTFEAFVSEYLEERRRPFADLGNQHAFCTDATGRLLVRYLFSYAKLAHLDAFLAERFGPLGPRPRRNASAPKDMSLSRRTKARLEAVHHAEFSLFTAVDEAGWRDFGPGAAGDTAR